MSRPDAEARVIRGAGNAWVDCRHDDKQNGRQQKRWLRGKRVDHA